MALGPKVTYLGNYANDKRAVTMSGIVFRPGKAVDLNKELGEQRAKPLLQKLAGNTFFKVDGGPDWSERHAELTEHVEAQEEELRHAAPATLPDGSPIPESIKTPEAMTLETRTPTPSPRRKAT